MKKKGCFLTTFDNRFDPYEEFEDWYRFDCDMGYYSLDYLNRVVQLTDSMSEPEEDAAYERAINDIIKNDIFNRYTKKYVEYETDDPMEDDPRSLDDLIAEYYATRSRGA